MNEFEEYTTGTGQRMWVHAKGLCLAQYCCIHNPSPHHMVDWPTHWREDRDIMERIDPLGVGHPDPDDLTFRQSVAKTQNKPIPKGIHGCNGMCNPSSRYRNSLKEKVNG